MSFDHALLIKKLYILHFFIRRRGKSKSGFILRVIAWQLFSILLYSFVYAKSYILPFAKNIEGQRRFGESKQHAKTFMYLLKSGQNKRKSFCGCKYSCKYPLYCFFYKTMQLESKKSFLLRKLLCCLYMSIYLNIWKFNLDLVSTSQKIR